MIVQRDAARALIARCKEAGVKVVAGRPLFTMEHEQFLDVDHFVLNEADVEWLVQDVQHSTSEDNRRRETIQSRNEADQAIYQVEKSHRNLGEKVSAPDRAKIEAQVNKLKEAMQGEDTRRIRTPSGEDMVEGEFQKM